MAEEMNISRVPFSLEAEQAVLGAVLIDPDSMNDVADMLTPQDFYIEQNAQIYEIMYGMYTDNQTVDVVTLLEGMKTAGVYEEGQSKKYVLQLAEFVPTSSNIKKYARIVWEKSLMRGLIGAAGEIIDMCSEESDEFASILDASEQKIYDITNGRKSYEFTPMLQIVSDTYQRISDAASGNNDKYKGISTGLSDLDEIISGLNRSDLIVIAARPGVGKTSLAMNIAQYAATKDGKKAAVFSLEMSKEQLVARMLATQSRIPSTRLMRGDIRGDEWDRLTEAVDMLVKCKLRIDDNPSVTIAEMKAKIRREKNVDLLIIDYLQLMHSSRRSENRVIEVAEITRSLKIMAKELNIPVVVLSQLSRGSESRNEPVLSDLRESGAIEQDADIVLMLYRDENPADEQVSIAKCKIAKNRHGRTDTIELYWDGELTQFKNVDKVHNE
ncbi:MAG: replicative DNA helicase [Bacillota bacterium]|nr:replicative DNA helicase [Bacillota bacterium]